MATLQASIKMMDYFSQPVRNMAKAIDNLSERVTILNAKNVTPKIMDDINGKLSQIKKHYDDFINSNNKWNGSLNRTKNSMDGIMSKLKAIALAYASIQGVKTIINLSDKTLQLDARLNLITDNAQQKSALKEYIYKQAQEARAPVEDFENQVAKVGLLAGDKFKGGNKEIVDYVTTLSKAFRISGTEAQEASAAMYQLNQALVSGRLQGDEFRSVTENAPMLAQAIAKQMGVPMEQLKKLGSEGKITSDIIRKAVIGMSEDVNAKFKALPLTWGDAFIQMKNFAIKSMESILQKINQIVNNPKIRQFGATLSGIFKSFLVVMNSIFDVMGASIAWIYDKWDTLKYPIITLTSAFIAYKAVLGIANAIIAINAGIEAIRTLALIATQKATFAATVAQHGLNTAVLLYPGTWIIAAIAGVISATVLLIKSITGATTVVGIFGATWGIIKAYVYDVWAGLVNAWYITKEAFIGGLNILINSTVKKMTDFANIFVDSFNWITNQATKFINGLLGILNRFSPVLDKIGINIPDSIQNNLKLEKISIQSPKIGNSTEGKRLAFKNLKDEGIRGAKKADDWWNGKRKLYDVEKGNDTENLGGKGLGENPDILKNIGDTAKNTGKMASNLEDTQEEMKYLRELAEQEHINQFTTAEIKVDMQNTNHIKEGADFDDLVRELTEKLVTQLKITANGVYN